MKKQNMFVSEEEYFDLMHYKWDDKLFSDILAKNNSIDAEQAMDISRFLRKEIANLKHHQTTLPDIDRMIKNRLIEFGYQKICRFDWTSPFL